VAAVPGLPAAGVVPGTPRNRGLRLGRPVSVEFPDGRAKVNRTGRDFSRILEAVDRTPRRPMPNDAKLGLLAGVAGVVLAAVLYFPNPAPGPSPSPAGPPAAAALPTAPAAVARAAPPVTPAEKPPAAAVAGTRAEVEAVPTSRPAADEDE
jgi:hypothetical protein